MQVGFPIAMLHYLTDMYVRAAWDTQRLCPREKAQRRDRVIDVRGGSAGERLRKQAGVQREAAVLMHTGATWACLLHPTLTLSAAEPLLRLPATCVQRVTHWGSLVCCTGQPMAL